MKHLIFLLLVTACGSVYEAGTVVEKTKQSACHEYGEAPFVTTISSPAGSTQLHPDCVKLDEKSSLGQDVYCCMGDDFDAWYGNL